MKLQNLSNKKSDIARLAVIALLACCPLFLSKYKVLLLCKAMMLALVSMSYIMLNGFGGMPTFACISFYGISAYTIAIGSILMGLGGWTASGIAVVLTLAVAALYAFVSVRAQGSYFLQISIAFIQLIYLTVIIAAEYTRGLAGIAGAPITKFFGLDLTNRNTMFFFTFVVVGLCYFAIKGIVSSPFGVALQGVRDNSMKMASLGFNVKLHRFFAIMLSAFFCAVAGVLWMIICRAIAPENVGMGWAITIVLISMLGSAKHIEGALVGAALYVFAEDWLAGVTLRYRIVIGLFFILLVLFLPNGIFGTNYKTYRSDMRARFSVQKKSSKV